MGRHVFVFWPVISDVNTFPSTLYSHYLPTLLTEYTVSCIQTQLSMYLALSITGVHICGQEENGRRSIFMCQLFRERALRCISTKNTERAMLFRCLDLSQK